MNRFKVGDRVVHFTKGPATVVSKCKNEILLELDNAVGSPFEESARTVRFQMLMGSAKPGNYYWWPSAHMVSILFRKTFKGNI